MFLSGSFLGMSYLEKINQIPLASAYSKLNFYGNNIIDEIHVQNRLYSDEEVLNLQINDYPAWDGYTLLLSKFDQQDLKAGNILTLNSPITNWVIYRKDTDDKISKKLIELDVNTTEYTDYTVQGNKTYIYDIFPKTVNEIGEPLETSQTLADFWGWYLVDPDTQTVFMFDLNIESGEINNETDMTTYQSYGKYNSYSFGNRDYVKGSVSAIGGTINVNGELVNGVDYIHNLRAFINNKKDKLLKNSHGDIFSVITSGFKYKYIDDTQEQIFTVSFSFEESGSVS